MNPLQWITIATVKDGTLSTQQRLYFVDLLIDEMSEFLNSEYGLENWSITPTEGLPADFLPESYTIENGKLVKASEELIASRQAASLAAYNEGQRALREAEYRASTDPRVLELIADADPEIAAMKANIRARYPYKS